MTIFKIPSFPAILPKNELKLAILPFATGEKRALALFEPGQPPQAADRGR